MNMAIVERATRSRLPAVIFASDSHSREHTFVDAAEIVVGSLKFSHTRGVINAPNRCEEVADVFTLAVAVDSPLNESVDSLGEAI